MTMDRRKFLQTAAGAALAIPAIGARGISRSANAPKEIDLAIFAGVYSRFPLEEAARRIEADGFRGIVLDFAFADVRFDPLTPDWEAAKKIAGSFERRGVKVVGLSAYYNVIDPDVSRRKQGEGRMECLIANWKRLGSPIIATETGTLNEKSEWLESPENDTEKAYLQCRSAFQKLARSAEKTGAIVAIEPYWRNVIGTVDRAERLFREVDSPSLKLVMDPCNYFKKEDLPRMGPLLEEIFKRLGSRTVLAHAKDVKGGADGTDLPAAGLGVLDYPRYLGLLAGLGKRMSLALEHLTLEDVPRARDFVRAQLGKA